MPPHYQVFLSHSSADKPAVEAIARKLRKARIEPFLDKWHLVPGEPWQEALEQALDFSSTCAVFFGPGGLGPWHHEEMRAALDQRCRNPLFRVIPVLLPGAAYPASRDLPRFLARLTWVDFRPGLDSAPALHHLISGIKGIPPGEEVDLASARSLLDALPIEGVPAPGPLPQGSRMPLSHNPLFVGREADLRTLSRQLKAGETSAVGQVEVAAATGLGGIGKTQMACEFVYRYGRFFAGGVSWMSFADATNVPTEIADCGRSLGLPPGFDASTLEQQVRMVKEVWEGPLPRLLVFDNCEEEELLHRWRPRFGNARVLITSRRPEWDPVLGVKTIPLTTLPRPASIELLLRFRPDVPESEPALDGIADELGDLPLALHLAGSFLKTYRAAPIGQPAGYLESLRKKDVLEHPSLHGRGSGPSPTRHESDVGRTFDLSFERLDSANPQDALAAALLARAAWFAPGEPIPRWLLLKTVALAAENVDASLLLEDALQRLTALGLLETNERYDLLMHRLVAAWARSVDASEEAWAAVDETLLCEARRLNETRNPALILDWQVHLRAAANRAMAREDRIAARLCDELGLHLWLAGDYLVARPYLEKAVAIHEMVSGSEHKDLGRTLNILGAVLNHLKLFVEARPFLERALAIQEKIVGSEHPDTASTLNDLGHLLNQEGDQVGARSCHDRALAFREKILGENHADTARSLSNLSSVLSRQGDIAGARSYLERALAINERVLGQEHPDTANGLSKLGGLSRNAGKVAEARSYYRRALDIKERVLGQHPSTAITLNGFGLLLQDQGELEEARTYFERALRINEKVLGDHPDTAIAYLSLGSVLRKLGDLAGARSCYERGMSVSEKALGPEDPTTVEFLTALGGLHFSQGNIARARWYVTKALRTLEATLGPHDPETQSVRRNLSMLPGARRISGKRPRHRSDKP